MNTLPTRSLYVRLYDAALSVFPAAQRIYSTPDMRRTFVDRLHDLPVDSRLAIWRFVTRECFSAVATGLTLHFRRDAGGHRQRWTRNWMQDARDALRNLRRRPSYTIITVSMLALGIGSNTAVFTVFDSVLLRPLGYEDADRLVTLWERPSNGIDNPPSFPDFLDWRARATQFSGLAFARGQVIRGNGLNGPDRMVVGLITSDFFEVVQGTPAIGRVLGADDFRGTSDVIVLAYPFWQTELGGDPDVIGTTFTFFDGAYTVVGVMDQGFGYLTEWANGWVPLTQQTAESALLNRGFRVDNRVIGRLTPETDVAAAATELQNINLQLAQLYPDTNRDWTVSVIPLRDRILGDVRPTLLILSGAVAMVLLIACSNVANLTLTRITSRDREIALRMSLGAGRARIVRHVLTESTIVAIGGALIGVGLAFPATTLLSRTMLSTLPRSYEIAPNGSVLLYAVVLTAIASLLVGLVPALRSGSADIANWLRSSRMTSPRSEAVRTGLVISQVALASVLLVGSGLLIQSLRHLQRTNVGFDPRGLLTLRIEPQPSRYGEAARRSRLYRDIQERVAAVPGVQSAAIVSHRPLVGGGVTTPVDYPDMPPSGDVRPVLRPVSVGYFETMAIPVLRGRSFQASDMTPTSNALIINQQLAAVIWPNDEPLGRNLTVFKQNPDAADFGEPVTGTVVGVVSNTLANVYTGDSYGIVYLPQDVHPWRQSDLIVRASLHNEDFMRLIRQAIREVDGDISTNALTTMQALMDRLYARDAVLMTTVSSFAIVALILASLGIYGVMSYIVAQQTRDIGVRMALGAAVHNIVRRTIARGMLLAGSGAAIGLALGFVLTDWLRGLIYGLSPRDPFTLVVVMIVTLTAALIASFMPARRAARTDPVTALRAD